jgi:hypothetical protein
MLAQGKSERVTLPKLQELMGQAIACGSSISCSWKDWRPNG